MNKQIRRSAIKLLVVLFCIVIIGFCVSFIVINQKENTAYADTARENSTYAYTPLNDTECSIKLLDKTIEIAVVPNEVEINGVKFTVTTIANNGFSSATNLRKVRLPKTVTTIGTTAFANCKQLKSITMPAVQSIGTNAFNLCTNLEYLIIPESVTSVGSTILRSTSTQVYVRISESATQELGWNANWNGNNENQEVEYKSNFSPSIEYTPITMSTYNINSVDETVVGYWVDEAQPFSETREEKVFVYIPSVYNGKPVIGIKEGAFTYNDIEILTVGYSSEPIAIESFAFNGLNGSKVVINRDIEVTEFTEFLFADSTVSEIYLPNTLSLIASNMFNGCDNLTDIHFLTPDSEIKDEENILEESTNIIQLPDSVEYIGEEAFSFLNKCNILKINIPHSVKTVGKYILNGWGSPQTVVIDYDKESDLPDSWDPDWKTGCQNGIIMFSGKFSITYVLNGGTHTDNPTEYTSSDNIVLNDAFKEGSTFDGWFTNEEFYGDPITVVGQGLSGDLTLYAKFTSISYVVHYNKNKPDKATYEVEGETVESTFTYKYENEKKNTLRLNGFRLIGWGFVGWNTEADGSGNSYTDGSEVENLTSTAGMQVELYAQWVPDLYTIHYISNKPSNASGLLIGNMEDTQVYYEESKNLRKNNFSLQGWTFNGWNTQADGYGISYEDEENVSNLSEGKSVVLYAQWSPNTYIIHYNANKPSNASGTITGSMGTTSIQYEQTGVLLINNYQLTGWRFDGWNTKANRIGDEFIDGEEVKNICFTYEIILYAQWRQNTYTIIYEKDKEPSSEYGTVMGEMNKTTHTYDEPSQLNPNLYYCQQPANVSQYIQEIVGWATIEGGEVVYKTDAVVSTVNSEDGGETVLYAVWDFVRYTVYTRSPLIGNWIYYRSYTYEDSVTIYDWNYGDGYIFEYEIHKVPKHTTEHIYVEGKRREIKYTLTYYVNGKNVDGNGGTTLKSPQVFELNYFDEITFTAQKYKNYIFKQYNLILTNLVGSVPPFEVVQEWTESEITIKQLTLTDGAVFDLVEGHQEVYEASGGGPCVAEGTLITLADGIQIPVEKLKGNESLLVWNLFTGKFDVAPILFIDSDPETFYEVINLYFSDGTNVKVISEHAFWDFNLNEYVFLRNDAAKYIGHWFNKQITDDGQMTWTRVQLVNVIITEEYTTAWSPVTYGHLCYYVNGMLSMPGATEGLINIFEVDSDTLKINEVAMQHDIEKYGLFTYEEFAEIYPITEEIFNAFAGQYLKVSIGKGLIDLEKIGELIAHYAEFLI